MARPKSPPDEKRKQFHPCMLPEYAEIWERVQKLYNCSPGRAADIITRSAMNNPDFSKTLADVDKLRGA